MKKQFYIGIFVVMILSLSPLSIYSERSEPIKTEVHGHTMYTVLKPSEIPAIFEPVFVTVPEAENLYYDDEPLLIVQAGDEVKGYSTWQLDANEVVNDYINGKAITVTWCPLCFTGIVYAAEIDGKRYTFQASGSLWQDALVMQDVETESLWSQVSGMSISGTMENTELELYPSSVTSFGEFKKLYPNGKLLKKPTKGLPNSLYQSYFTDRTRLGVLGRVDNFSIPKGKEMIIGLRDKSKQVAITEKVLKKKEIILVTDLSKIVLVSYNKESNTITAFDVTELGKNQKFNIDSSKFSLEKSDLSWDSKTGKLLSGNGQNLELVPFTTSFWFAWASFFPKTKLIK